MFSKYCCICKGTNIEIQCKWIDKMPWGVTTQYTLWVSNPRPDKVYWAARGHTLEMCTYFKNCKVNTAVMCIIFRYSFHLQSAKQPIITSVALCHKEFGDSWHRYIYNKLFLFYVLLIISIISIILDNDQLNARLFYFTIRLLYSTACFEHYILIIRRLNCIDAASGIVTLKTSELSGITRM